MLTQDASDIVHEGLFTGYNILVIISIILQAVLGLVSVIYLSIHLPSLCVYVVVIAIGIVFINIMII